MGLSLDTGLGPPPSLGADVGQRAGVGTRGQRGKGPPRKSGRGRQRQHRQDEAPAMAIVRPMQASLMA